MTARETYSQLYSEIMKYGEFSDRHVELIQAYARHVAEKREADLLEWFDGANSDTWAYAGLQIDRNQIETP